MKFFKINNLIEDNPLFGQAGTYNYKNLDINFFVPGSQVYPEYDNFCLVATTEIPYTTNKDVEELTEQKYNELRKELENNNERFRKPSEEELNAKRISELENLILEGQGVV